MKLERLGNMCSIRNGYAFKSENFTEGGVPIIRISDINDNQVTPIKAVRIKYEPVFENFKIENGDILIAMSGATTGKYGIFKSDEIAYQNQRVGCFILKDESKLNKRFLLQAIRILKPLIEKAAYGGGQPNISAKNIEDLKIPVPNISDQLHIANILTRAETLITQRKESIRLLDEFLKSTFLEMFYMNPEISNWDLVKFEKLADSRKGSMRTGPFGSSLLHGEFTEDGDVKVLGIDNVVTNRFDWKRSRCITLKKFQELKRYQVYPYDVLISIMATLGRTAVVPEDIPISINSKHLAAITLNRSIANPYFVAYAFHSHPSIVRQMNSSVKGAIMDGLNLTIIKRIMFKLPPVKLQNEFGDLFIKTEVLKAQYQSSLQELENLYGSLSQRAFRGDLRVKDEELLMAAEPEIEYT